MAPLITEIYLQKAKGLRKERSRFNMKYWPVPESYSKKVPERNAPGRFWENRGDRHHCGVDIYAPEGSEVVCVEDGTVIEVGVFTSPERIPYWNVTHEVLIQHADGLVSRYAELGRLCVGQGDPVTGGQVIGHVGRTLDQSKIGDQAPPYIQKLNHNNHQSMLHFELYRAFPRKSAHYLGGNTFENRRPERLVDPTAYLKSIETAT